jgi:hypothetical protein
MIPLPPRLAYMFSRWLYQIYIDLKDDDCADNRRIAMSAKTRWIIGIDRAIVGR